jgi:AAA15 family ATPase/GTPase
MSSLCLPSISYLSLPKNLVQAMAVSKKKPVAQKVGPIIEIKNFKSVLDVKITASRVNVLFGRPNSGKSNILEALSLFNFIQPKIQRQVEGNVMRYNTLDNLFYDRNLSEDIRVDYKGNVAVLSYYPGANGFLQMVNPEPKFLKNKNAYYKRGLTISDFQAEGAILPEPRKNKFSALLSLLTEEGQLSSPAWNGSAKNPVRRYEFRDGISYSNPFRGYLMPFGENLFTIVQENSAIKEWISSFFEGFNLEFLLDYSSKKFEIQKKENGIVYKIPFELTPDTLRRMLFYVAAIYSNKDATILLEEPESHTFPPYIKELSEMIKDDKNNTYFITTHSPYFINSLIEDSLQIKDISFFHVYYESYQTKIKKLTRKDLDVLWGSGADVFFNLDSVHK